MTVTISRPAGATPVPRPIYTVGVEPMPAEMRDPHNLIHWHARVAVVLRCRGALASILTTDNDPSRDASLIEIAEEFAAYGPHLFTVAAPTWPTCGYCNRPDPECPDLWMHQRWAADNEAGRLGDGLVASVQRLVDVGLVHDMPQAA